MKKDNIIDNSDRCMKLHINIIKAMESEQNIECQLIVLIEMIRQIIEHVEKQVPDIEDQIISEIRRKIDYDKIINDVEWKLEKTDV